MRWAIVTLLVAGQAEGGACPDFENITRPMWSIHGGKVDLVKSSEGKVMAKVRCLEGFDMVGDNDLLEADFIEGGCWNLTKRHNVVCKEVTGCDPYQLPTKKTGIEKTKSGANSFKFWCKDTVQKLVQAEAPYHQAQNRVFCTRLCKTCDATWSPVPVCTKPPGDPRLTRAATVGMEGNDSRGNLRKKVTLECSERQGFPPSLVSIQVNSSSPSPITLEGDCLVQGTVLTSPAASFTKLSLTVDQVSSHIVSCTAVNPITLEIKTTSPQLLTRREQLIRKRRSISEL